MGKTKRIKLTEQQLRNFINYSVAKILKEYKGLEEIPGYYDDPMGGDVEPKNLGQCYHNDGLRSVEEPGMDMTWEEYCEKNSGGDSEDKEWPEKASKGTMMHFPGHEEF